MKAETESALVMLIDQPCFLSDRIFDLTLTKSTI